MTTHPRMTNHGPALKTHWTLHALRYLSLLSTLTVLFQGATAGEILMKSHEAKEFHEIGAIVLHVFAGLTMTAAAAHWRTARTSIWPTALSAVVFAATFVQAAYGHGRTLYIHVPLALLVLLGATWILAWSWLPNAATTRAQRW